MHFYIKLHWSCLERSDIPKVIYYDYNKPPEESNHTWNNKYNLSVFQDMTLFLENCNYLKKFKKSTKPEVKESRTNFNNESTM